MDQLILDQAINDVIMEEEDGELDIVNDPAEFGPGLGFDEDSSDSDSDYRDGTDRSDNSEVDVQQSSGDALSRDDQLYMIHMRSFIDQLQAKVSEKTQVADKIREELKKCQERILELEVERDTVYRQTKSAENDENISELHRLIAHHDRVCEELDQEGNMCQDIKSRLEAAEYELNKAEVERGKYFQAEFLLEEKEMLQKRERSDVANRRLRQEIQCADKVEQAFQNHERQMQDAIAQRKEQNQVAMETITTQQKFAKKNLASSLGKLKEKEDKNEADYKNYHQQRMDMLIQLKSNISNNRENLKAIHARDKAKGRELEQIEMKHRDAISGDGGNPDETMLVRKRLEEFDKQQRDFEQKQKKSHAEIMQKLIAEEKDMKKRKKMQPDLYLDPKKEVEKNVAPHKRPIPQIIQDASEKVELIEDVDVFMTVASSEEQMMLDKVFGSQEEVAEVEQQLAVKKDDAEDERLSVCDGDDYADEEKDDSSDDEPIRADESVGLARPEFEGLWNVHKSYNVPDDIRSAARLPAATKMEKEILQKVLDKHRAGIVNKQVVAGREFKGCPFNSKPDVIHFKDFTVGKSYRKRIVLTNVSYSINYCKYLGVTEHLKDFIEIEFNPPGQLSAGMTTDIMVTFKPMINDDLFGEVHFLAQSAPFSIPLKCTTKKCDLSVDSSKIEFGTAVIGETLRRTLTLVNKGAQGTKFDFYKLSGMKHGTVTTADTSLGRLSSDDSIKADSPAFDEATSKPIIPGEQEKTDEEIAKPSSLPDGVRLDMPGTCGDQETEDPQPGDGQMITDLAQSDIETHQGVDDLHSSDLGDIADLCGMKVGPMSTGLIPPFSTVKLEIIWSPTVPGRVDTDFVIAFEDPLSESIAVCAFANAVDVPVWVERESVDLKICMFDRLYQDTIIVHNRATTALRLKFEVCRELRNHLELLPKTGYIQAQSSFSAQLKFLPRQSLFEDASKYFDKETGVLEAQLLIRVADQTKPVPFMVQAVVTGTDMEFSINSIDFGAATIYESVKTSIKLTNNSILSQQFGFLGLAEYVSVQPNDGFGTLLPLETISLDVIFSPKKARDYKFELNCKSLINRDFKVQCRGTGVHPPLELSHQVVNFAATSLYDISMATLNVINAHKSTNEFTHPVPRIGKGEIAPVGPTSFEFVVPEGIPLSVAPAVGTVLPGQKSRVQIRFSPKLDEAAIRKEAVRMSVRQMEAKANREYNEALQKQKEQQEQLAQGDDPDDKQKANSKAKPKRTSSGKGNKAKSGSPNLTENIVITKPTPVEPPSEDSIIKNSPPYCAAVGSLLRQFKGHFQTCVIPCYVASGACTDPGELPYSIHNTLYIEVHCPTVRPPVVVISDSGQTTTEFGDVSIGQHVTKSVTIQNISDEVVELNSSILNTNGPFLMLNALRVLPPDGSHTILLSFKPSCSEVFHEVMEIRSSNATLFIVLSGKGVDPSITLSVDEVLDMGPVLNGEYIEKTFQLHNVSSLSVDYDIKLDSLSLLRYSKSQGLPSFINVNSTGKRKPLVGTQNFNGQCVFDSVPMRGSIPAGSVEEIMVTFAPDHVSDHYSDNARIELFGQEESYSFRLIGQCKQHVMYIEGVDERAPAVESLAILPYGADEEAVEAKPEPIPVLFTLQCTSQDNELMPASRDVFFGCVRTMAVSQKKSGEFAFDNVQPIMAKGFNIEPQKGLVEAGAKKAATITWTPPPGHDPSQPMDASIVVTLRGDFVDQYRLMLKGLVVSAPT